MSNATDFNLIAFQDQLIRDLDDIELSGVGDHRRRSRGLARRNAIKRLMKIGYTGTQAADAVRQAFDVWQLQLNAA